ncbi:Ig-like domain-containing protein [Catalinimonas niigatensis]|uniref:Ig-like domain-containing protein n=1 Tax=Catalinimonas niigatensis TaxID=1397264 RepID=UPI002665422A|nr:Ig-like domain-containing protein [Catalinimonas niigatensis]WPP50373.1 Ig-like domain-containing protein [Catalinimonas niigatensis]
MRVFWISMGMLFFSCSTLLAQDWKIVTEPAALTLDVEKTAQIKAKVVDADGKEVSGQEIFFYSRKGKAVEVDTTGLVTAHLPGEHKLIVIAPPKNGGKPIRLDYPVKVNFPPISEIKVEEIPAEIYAGTTLPLQVTVMDEMDLVREEVQLKTTSTDPAVASADPYLNLKAHKPGKTTVTVTNGEVENKLDVNVIPFPAKEVKLEGDREEARTGDVFHFTAKVVDDEGNEISDAPVTYSFQGKADDVSSSASGLIKQDGRFVADVAGMYTIMAASGPYVAQQTIKIVPREVDRKIELVGKGSVDDKHTSDFWVWEGVDGRDYAVTGTWGADGKAYFWDVTNPAAIERIDSIQVDARTVNDVKVSEDGKICIISREGASNRKNGIVIIDVTNPREAEVISTFTENLTGGVHNLYIYQNHVYALSAGQKYYVINIDDPKQPRIVSKFELETPAHSIHDVWVQDGIAYSSNWSDGIQLVDVGNGIAGGSPENPKQFASYAYPSGANHATFPFKSKSTDKFYVIGGDEIFPYGLDVNKENMAAGFLHFIDFSDLENPDEIARFEVPNAGSHNYWVDEENELLYASFYNGGVRVVDISGELMGDLYKQGREIAWIIPSDPDGYIPNAPFTWGAQPYKGHIFYSDWNSGLWAAKLEPETPEETRLESR